jgi:hypothetical protein
MVQSQQVVASLIGFRRRRLTGNVLYFPYLVLWYLEALRGTEASQEESHYFA